LENVYILVAVTHRTTIELDEALLEETRKVLGTSGIRETVEGAMREVTRAAKRVQLAERIRTGEGFDRGPEILDASRPTR
jgi:Arc/MetJ family transcription regulator